MYHQNLLSFNFQIESHAHTHEVNGQLYFPGHTNDEFRIERKHNFSKVQGAHSQSVIIATAPV